MILKKLKRTNLKRSKAAMIGELVDYVLAQKDEQGFEKRQYSYGFNFVAKTSRAWKQEMIALSQETIHSKMPVTHWMMSWQENEVPTRKQVIEAVDIFLDRMGLGEHQAIVAAHKNTANFHIHIVVNRVHPLTEKVVQPHKGFDIEAAHRIVAEIEHKQGWASNKHARYRVNEKGRIVRNQLPKEVKPKPKVLDFESMTGEKSVQRMAQERVYDIIRNAENWKALHYGLARENVKFIRKGSGAVLLMNGVEVKASSVDRNFSFGKLCKRLGEYEEIDFQLHLPPPFPPEPVSHICKDEWREYQEERRRYAEERQMERERRLEAQRLEREKERQERETALARIAPYGLPVLNIARHCMMLQQQSQKTEKKAYQAEPRKRLPHFKNWLALKNHWLAQLWRFRNRITPDMQVREYNFPQRCKLERPLYAFQAMTQERYADMPMDKSRLDAATALYLRCAGYKAETVDQEMMRHSPRPTTEAERDDSFEQRTRILQYAYGTAGDVDIAASNMNMDQLERLIADAEQKDKELQDAIAQQKLLRTGDPDLAYHVHANNIRQHMPRIENATLDAMIALRMRSNGHSKEAITKAITRMTSVARMTWDEQRQKHAERVVQYAFGLQGTHDMMRNKPYWAMWRKVEGVQEVQQKREEERPVWRMR